MILLWLYLWAKAIMVEHVGIPIQRHDNQK